MEINYPVKKENKFRLLLQLFATLRVNPFSSLRNRELEVYAELLNYYLKYKDMDQKDKYKLIFNYDTRLAIADTLGVHSIDIIYNVMSTLKKKGFIDEKGISEGLAEKLLKFNTNSLKINFHDIQDKV